MPCGVHVGQGERCGPQSADELHVLTRFFLRYFTCANDDFEAKVREP